MTCDNVRTRHEFLQPGQYPRITPLPCFFLRDTFAPDFIAPNVGRAPADDIKIPVKVIGVDVLARHPQPVVEHHRLAHFQIYIQDCRITAVLRRDERQFILLYIVAPVAPPNSYYVLFAVTPFNQVLDL